MVSMKKNIGTTDRLIRLALAIVLLFLAWWYSSWIILAVSLFCFYEVIAGWCVLFQFLGKNSCPLDKR